MAAANVVETVLKLRGSREFQKAAQASAKSLLGIGEAGDDAGKKAAGGWKGVAKWAGGAAAIGGTVAYMKDAVNTTEGLAKQTMALQRATGLDTKTASEWAAVLKVRGVDTNKFQVGLTKLSKTMESARGGNEKAAMSLMSLGVTQDQIKKGDINGVIMASADAFSKMENPAKKAATASALFGKSGQALLPMLSAGSAGLKEQLDMADSYGASLDGNATDAVKKQIAAQREWDMAMLGLKVQMGSGVLPVLAQLAGAVSKILNVFKPLMSNSKVLQITIVALGAAFVGYKIATVAATVASWGLTAAVIKEQAQLMLLRIQLLGLKIAQLALSAATKAWAAAQWLLNAAMSANPIGLVVIAIVGLIAVFVILYKKVGWFREAVQAVWGWIKANWPLLLAVLTGPFGLAVLVIVKNFDKIKSAASSVWNFVKDTFGKIKNFVRGIFSGAGEFVSGIGRSIADWINDHTPFGDKVDLGPVHFTIPALAEGGTMRRGGVALVGERGPEIVALPAAATVYPSARIAPVGMPGGLDTDSRTIVTKVYLDRKQIAEAVGSYAADKRARR